MSKVEIKTIINGKEVVFNINVNGSEIETDFNDKYAKEDFLDFMALNALLIDKNVLLKSLALWGKFNYGIEENKLFNKLQTRLAHVTK